MVKLGSIMWAVAAQELEKLADTISPGSAPIAQQQMLASTAPDPMAPPSPTSQFRSQGASWGNWVGRVQKGSTNATRPAGPAAPVQQGIYGKR